MEFLTEQKILYLEQLGFRKIFSTAYAIIKLIDKIGNAFDKNKFACGVSIDLKKAFDSVDVWHYGIREIASDCLNPILQKECNTFQLMESRVTFLKLILEFYKGQFLVLYFSFCT